MPVQDPDAGASLQELLPLEAPTEDLVAGTGRGKDRFKFWDLFADERCSQAVLDFLSTTGVERRLPEPG